MRWAWETHPCTVLPSLPACCSSSEQQLHAWPTALSHIPVPSLHPWQCQTSQNIFKFSQGNPPQEYFKHRHLKMPSLLQLTLRSYPEWEGRLRRRACQTFCALFPSWGLGLSTEWASALDIDTTKGWFSKESIIFILIQFKIWLETHFLREPFLLPASILMNLHTKCIKTKQTLDHSQPNKILLGRMVLCFGKKISDAPAVQVLMENLISQVIQAEHWELYLLRGHIWSTKEA